MKKYVFHKGFSLLEVLLAISMLGGISFLLMSMFQQSNKSVNQIEYLVEKEQLRMLLLGQFLSSPVNCRCLFQGASEFPVAGINELVGFPQPSSIGRFQSNTCAGGVPRPLITTSGVGSIKLMKVTLSDITIINGKYQGDLAISVKRKKEAMGVQESLIKIPVSISTVPGAPGFVSFSSCQLSDTAAAPTLSGRANVTVAAGRISPVWGGGGGSEGPNYHTCPADHFIYSLYVRSGSRIDNLSARCKNLDESNEYEFNFPGVGGGGGSFAALDCPAGSFAYGVSGRAGSKVDRLMLKCRNPQSGALSNTSIAGGGGGSSFDWDCPAGEYIFDIFTNSGDEIDSFGVRCSSL